MKVIHAKGVELDVCTKDDWIWLDGGEMARFRPGLRDQTVHDSRNVVIHPKSAGVLDAILDLFA